MRAFLGLFLATTMAMVFLAGYCSGTASAQRTSAATDNAQKLPPDIDPDSLSRMPRPRRVDFATEQEKQAFDRVMTVQGEIDEKNNMQPHGVIVAKGWLGPTGTRAQIPEVAEVYKQLDMVIKDKSGLDRKYVELAILMATRESSEREEFLGHADRSIKERLLGPKVVEVIRNNLSTEGLDEKEAEVIQFGRELFLQPKVSSKTFAAVDASFGRRGTLSLTLLMCYYESNGLLLRAYDQHLGPERDHSLTW
jgi:4-carboxymuconolactone decarboxylase